MESFILEPEAGFTFVARQKRMTIGDDDFYLDLLFYHRKLRQLDKSGIRVAAYLTELPPQDVLRKKLHEVMTLARKQLAGPSSGVS